MGFGKSTSTSSPRINQLAVQTSSLGLPISLGWGRGRLKCNLLWYNAFKANSQTKKTGGKGMGGTSKNTTYTYTASVIMGLCEGPITGVRTVYRDKNTYKDYIQSWTWDGETYGTVGTTALQQAGLNLATGSLSQTPWGYLTSSFPSQALAYRGIAYVYAQDYALTDNATLSNHSFEVDFATQLAGLPDADPKDIVTDLLTNTSYGLPGWGSGLIGSLTEWSNYCKANNLLLSPVLEEQRAARDLINEWCDATNSAAFWSEGLLKISTFGDTAATGNGATFTPNLTPQYNLTEDDFQPIAEGVPVQLEIVDQSDAYNIVQVEFLDRNNQYNVAIESAQDLSNIVQYGKRKRDPVRWPCICDPQIARNSCQLLLQRTLYRREKYRFKLPWNFVLLEPMDYVSLTTTTDQLKLTSRLVQIVDIEESDDDLLLITAEGVNVGTASAPAYSSHSGSAVEVQTQVAPGSISNPVLFNAPPALTGLDPELWIAVSGQSGAWGGCEVWISADNVTFERAGRIDNSAKVGVSTSAISNVPDPDTTNTLGVNMAASQQQLISSSATNVDNGSTLFMLGDELMAYQNAALVSANNYNLTTLRRGLYGTTRRLHTSGEQFTRMDDSVFKLPYNRLNYGKTMYVKFLSFNIFGQALDQLSSVSAYSVALPAAIDVTNYRDQGDGGNEVINSDLTTDTSGFYNTGDSNLAGTGFAITGGRNYSGYFGQINTFWSRAAVSTGSLSTGGYVMGWGQRGFGGNLADLQRYALPVSQNDRIYVAARVSVHGFTRAVVRVRLYARDGTFIGDYDKEATGVDARQTGPTGANGIPANFNFLNNFINITPANAAFAVMSVYGDQLRSGQTDCFVFSGQHQLTRVSNGQLAIPPYVPGPADRTADRTIENTANGIVGQGSGATANSLSQLNVGEGIKLSGIATGATRNVTTTGLLSARPTGADGDFYFATDDNNGVGLLYSKIAGAWVSDPKAKVLFDSLTTTVNGYEATNSAFRSAQASDNAAQATRLNTLDASYRFPMPEAINKNPNFSSWSGASGTYPEDWVDWANGSANTKETGSLSPFAFRMNVAANTANQGIQQIMSGKMALGWHVLECEVTLNSGDLTGAAMHLNWGVSAVTNSNDIRLATDPDITGAIIGGGTAGRRYRFSKLINITVVPNISVLYCMSAWTGILPLSPAKDLTWHKCLVRPASQAEIDAKVAKDTTIPDLTARVGVEESARASADSALATRAATLEARSYVKGNLVKGARPNYDASNPNNLFSRFGWRDQGLWSVSNSLYVDGPYLSHSITSQTNYNWYAMCTNAVPVVAGTVMSAQAMLGKFGSWNNGTVGIVIYWYSDTTGTTLNSGATNSITQNWEDGLSLASLGHNGQARLCRVQNQTVPAGTQSARIGIFLDNATGNGVYSEAGAWMLKLECGGVCTAWTDDALPLEIDARVRVEESTRSSGDSANASQITTVQARLNSPYVNLVRNSSGEYGVFAAGANPADGNWWLTDTAIVMGIASPSDHVGGLHRYISDFTNFVNENFYSIAFEHYGNHMVFGGAFYNNQTTGAFQFQIFGYTAGGAPYGAISTRDADGNNPNTAYAIPAGGWTQITRRVIPSDIPSGCTHFRIVFQWVNYKGYAGLSRLQGHLGQVLPPFAPNNGDPYSLNAQVINVNSVAVDGRGRAYAISGTQTEVNGRKGGFVMDNNGEVTNFQITADDFRIYQSVGGSNIVPFRVVGGQTQINDALIRTLSVIPDGGGPSHRVQLRPNSVTGVDGASFTFSPAYGGIPLIRPVILQPPALASGETYDISATALSASGFTIRAKKFTAGTPTAQSSGAGSNVGGTPAWQAGKPTAADADGSSYTFNWTATIPRISNEFFGGPGWYAEYYGEFDIYYNAGSGWVYAYTAYLSYEGFYSGSSPTSLTGQTGATSAVLPAIGQHGGNEFGIHAVSGTITAFAGVSYTTTSQSSVVALPGNFTFDIYAPT